MASPDEGFWEGRFGLDSIRRRLLDRPIPAEVGWLHAFGSIALSLIAVLFVTGILLTFNYSPSTEHAFHSVRFIEVAVPLGSLVRGLHYWAASGLVVVLLVHLFHTCAGCSFARPREMIWCSGILVFVVVLVFGFTGYLLPWDEKAYWATVVGTNMVAQFPVVGTTLQHMVRGGAEVGSATLSRFYGAHVTLLPLVLVALVVVHLYLVVLHGISAKETPDREKWPRTVPFWPDVLARDAIAVAVALLLILILALHVGAPLEAPADPTNTAFVPRPEWYFLPLFQLLKLFPGSAEAIAAVAIPLVSVLILFALPWWSRPLRRTGMGRRVLLGGSVLIVGGLITLGVSGAMSGSASELSQPPAIARGHLLYGQLGCVNCHSIRGMGGIVGPDLTLIGLRRSDSRWLVDHLLDPRSIQPTSPMPSFPLAGEALEDLVAFLLSLGNDVRYSATAPELFNQHCLACHRLGQAGGEYGPNLTATGAIRSVPYIHQYIEDPTSLNPDARMPPTVVLSHEQVEDVSRYVAATGLTERWNATGDRGRTGGANEDRP